MADEIHEQLDMARAMLARARELASEGQYGGATAYARIAAGDARVAEVSASVPPRRQPPVEPVELPPWCGRCDGEPLSMRWMPIPAEMADDKTPLDELPYRRCPVCNPHSEQPQSALN